MQGMLFSAESHWFQWDLIGENNYVHLTFLAFVFLFACFQKNDGVG